MSTSLSDLPLPGGQQMDMGGQQQFDLNKMIDVAAQAQQPTYQNEPNISAGALQYQLDQSQIPQNGPTPNIQMQEPQYEDEMAMEHEYQFNGMDSGAAELSFFEKIMKDMKFAGIVAVLFIALSLPQFNKLLTGFVPRFLAETGEINMMGIAAKAVILAILFLSLKFVL